ncbi:MAG: HAMP domain-containing protein, partial [Betaproteobacteria bacterium]|nr:HAMP domain-containing protein [Betaproteobacteria bacterium]
MKRTLRYLLLAAALTVGVLLFLLAASSENARLFEDYYSLIFGANLAVGASLFVLVSFLLARLYSRYRRGRFGSKLMTRLVLLFTVMGIVPGIIIYMVSVQFVSRSIESWFNVEVESALESGLKLGRGALEASLADLRSRSRRVASELTDVPDAAMVSQLAKIAEREQLQDVLVVSENGRLIATAGGKLTRLAPELPTQAMIARAKTFDGFGIVEGEYARGPTAAGDFRLRVVVAILGDGSLESLGSRMRYLQVLQPVPEQLAANAGALRDAYSGYQESALAREGLRRFYLITLTLVLLLAVFAAMVSAFLLATDLAEPLLLLAEGTKAVAEGNLSPRPIVATSDELGTLTQSFNTMTMQLADARAAVERNRQALEDAKAYLESVLANMSAGVMVLDEQLKLVTFNASASRILHHDLTAFQGHIFASI